MNNSSAFIGKAKWTAKFVGSKKISWLFIYSKIAGRWYTRSSTPLGGSKNAAIIIQIAAIIDRSDTNKLYGVKIFGKKLLIALISSFIKKWLCCRLLKK
ncbi:MAG: hypothetical protein GWM89_01605 [Candidatus Dadabacteria bacterium]|nr:hypothetical protein [Candidatus Dadabacteria bacterium]NIY21129.1 hypothetical protein [Candidatus Dadabacteria bacterium]